MNSKAKLKLWSSTLKTVVSLETKAAQNSKWLLLNIADISCGLLLLQGFVFVQGSVMMEAATKDELWSIFERGSENRHVASTSKKKMI